MAVITLKNGDKIETKEDFDAVYSIWEHEPAVILLTEKNTGKRLVLQTQNIAMLGQNNRKK